MVKTNLRKKAFVSDFDGTITSKDFYHIIIDKYLGEEGRSFYRSWKKTQKINVEFLNRIFSMVSLDGHKWVEEAQSIPIDPYFEEFLRHTDMDFYVISAGSSFYIDVLFSVKGFAPMATIGLPGYIEGKHLVIRPDKNWKYYSDIFGVDKGLFVRDLKSQYDEVYFFGDSEPDYSAAIESDIAYAKSELSSILSDRRIPYIEVEDYKGILNHIKGKE